MFAVLHACQLANTKESNSMIFFTASQAQHSSALQSALRFHLSFKTWQAIACACMNHHFFSFFAFFLTIYMQAWQNHAHMQVGHIGGTAQRLDSPERSSSSSDFTFPFLSLRFLWAAFRAAFSSSVKGGLYDLSCRSVGRRHT